jgi:chromosome segregation ATPase
MDEFQALEQRVLRAVEIVKREREARAAAEAETAAVREELAAARREIESREAAARGETEAAQKILTEAQGQIDVLHQERDAVRQRVEKLLVQMDELG